MSRLADGGRAAYVLGLAVAVGVLALTAHLSTGAPLAATVVVGAGGASLSVGNLRLLTTRKQRYVYSIAFASKWFLVMYQALSKNLPMGGNDWEGYHRNAVRLLQASDGLWDIAVLSSTNLFNRLVAAVYATFGVSAEMVYFFVFLTSLVTFRCIFLIAHELGASRQRSGVTALLFMVWPIEVVLSVTFLREMPIQCLLAASFLHFIVYVKRRRLSSLTWAILWAGFATALHSGMLAILLTYFFIAIMLNSRRGIQFLNPLRSAAFVGVVVLLLTSSWSAVLLQKFGDTSSVQDVLVDASYVAGNTAYVTTVPTSAWDLVTQSPSRVFNFALAPLPWQARNAATAVAVLLDGLLRIWLVHRLLRYAVSRALLTPWEQAIRLTIVLGLATTYIIFAWGTANYGTAIRHRAKTFPIEIVAAYAIQQGSSNSQKRKGRATVGQLCVEGETPDVS